MHLMENITGVYWDVDEITLTGMVALGVPVVQERMHSRLSELIWSAAALIYFAAAT